MDNNVAAPPFLLLLLVADELMRFDFVVERGGDSLLELGVVKTDDEADDATMGVVRPVIFGGGGSCCLFIVGSWRSVTREIGAGRRRRPRVDKDLIRILLPVEISRPGHLSVSGTTGDMHKGI